MSNTCYNKIEFKDYDSFELAKSVLLNKDGDVDFSLLIPAPIQVCQLGVSLALEEEMGPWHWYSWNVFNWGTKWNACSTEVSDEQMSIKFETASHRPMPVLIALYNKISRPFTHKCVVEYDEFWDMLEFGAQSAFRDTEKTIASLKITSKSKGGTPEYSALLKELQGDFYSNVEEE